MLKLFALLGATLALASASPGHDPRPAPAPAYSSDEPRIDYNAITRIQCGGRSGTAFWIDRAHLVTAAHVTSGDSCAIDGHPLRTLREDGVADIAELTGLDNARFLHVRCEPPREGEVIFAVGYPDGLYRHTARLLSIGQRVRDDDPAADNQVMLLGQVFPGMSGGPMLDRRGRVTGITNRRFFGQPLAGSRALADTFICA